MASSKLPFVGERYFAFSEGNALGYSINIAKNGHVTMMAHGKFDSSIIYRGQYKKVMCDNDGECYKIISKDKIAQTDKKGRILKCEIPYSHTDVEKSCIVPLSEP